MKLKLEDDKDRVVVSSSQDYNDILNSHAQYCLLSNYSLLTSENKVITLKCNKCGFEVEYKHTS